MFELTNVIGHITINDLLDIAIVTVIIYQFLSIIQGTRAVQMIIGVFSLMILFAISVKYRFYALNWVLSHFFDSFFLILIILFQDQIRSALVTVGGKTSVSKKKSGKLDRVIDEVVEAISALSREKTGAIVVFEKRNGLLNYIETGTKLQSQIHADILYTLFQTNSPLHDGAAILAADKIEAAGCFLPLSKNLEIDRQYGTRHRAAIGISEGTDAVVVTVSEETGKINICHGGSFHSMTNEIELRKNLYKFLTSN